MRLSSQSVILLMAIVAVLMPGVSDPAGAVVPQDAEQQQALQRARESIDKGEARDALDQIEKVLDEDDELWGAHFLKGLALGQLGDEKKALESFLNAADLSPATPEVHFWAGMAAFGIGDMETCWHQTILAHLAGQDMTAEFEQLKEVSDPPDDWEARIEAPRVVIGQMDTSVTQSNSTLATKFQYVQGEVRVVQRMLTQEVLESPGFGLVRSSGLADYVMRIAVTDYGDAGFEEFEVAPGELVASMGTESHELTGQMQLFDAKTGELVHSIPLTFRDLTSAGDLSRDIRTHVERLEVWSRENLRK